MEIGESKLAKLNFRDLALIARSLFVSVIYSAFIVYLVPCAIYGIIQCIKFFLVIMSEPGCHYGTDPIILKFRQKKKSLHVFWFI